MDRRILETLSRDMDQSVPCTGNPIVLWGCALEGSSRCLELLDERFERGRNSTKARADVAGH